MSYMIAENSIVVEDEFMGYMKYPYVLKNNTLMIQYPDGSSLQFTKAKNKQR